MSSGVDDIEKIRKHLSTLPAGSIVRAHMEASLQALEATLKLTHAQAPKEREERKSEKESISSSSNTSIPVPSEVKAALLRACIPLPATPFAALALTLHCATLAEGFIATWEEVSNNGARGFAAPIRDVPETMLVPPGWDKEDHVASFRYRHPDSRGKVYQLTLMSVEGTCQVHFAEKSGEPAVMEFSLLDQASEGGSSEYYERVRGKLKALLSQVRPVPPPTIVLETTSRERQYEEPRNDPLRVGPPRVPVPVPVPASGIDGYGGGWGGDFSGDLVPGGGGLNPGSGGLMGPTHPAFTGGLGGLGIPQPRFDPYGPPIPPILPGQARPRGQRPPFGQPNPDHLPPPGSDNMFM